MKTNYILNVKENTLTIACGDIGIYKISPLATKILLILSNNELITISEIYSFTNTRLKLPILYEISNLIDYGFDIEYKNKFYQLKNKIWIM